MKIRAMSVFEGIVYHSACLDPSNPERPTLEVDAVLRDGDVDGGPVLLPWADFVYMVGADVAKRCFARFADEGRIVFSVDARPAIVGRRHVPLGRWRAPQLRARCIPPGAGAS